MASELLEGNWEVERVVHDFHDGTVMVRWIDYNHLQDTREPTQHVYPKRKLGDFHRSLIIDQIDVEQLLNIFRTDIARQLASRKIAERTPVYKKKVLIEEFRLTQLSLPLLRYLSRLVGVALKQEGTTWWLKLGGKLEKIGEALLFHTNGQGNGALRVKCGQASYEDMLCVWDLEIFVTETSSFGGRRGGYIYSTLGFNGRSGEPLLPKIPDGWDKNKKGVWEHDADKDERLTKLEISAIMGYVRTALQQRWTVEPVRHRLRDEAKWHLLPPSKWALPQALANPTKPAPKRKAPTPAAPAPPPKRVVLGREERASAGRVPRE